MQNNTKLPGMHELKRRRVKKIDKEGMPDTEKDDRRPRVSCPKKQSQNQTVQEE